MNWDRKTLKRVIMTTGLASSLVVGFAVSVSAQNPYWYHRNDKHTLKRHQKDEQRELKMHQRLEREEFGNSAALKRHQKEEQRELKKHQKREDRNLKRRDWWRS